MQSSKRRIVQSTEEEVTINFKQNTCVFAMLNYLMCHSFILQNTMVNQVKAIDEWYNVERSKIMKSHEVKPNKKLLELDGKRLKEIQALFQKK